MVAPDPALMKQQPRCIANNQSNGPWARVKTSGPKQAHHMTTIRGVYHGDRIEIRERLDFPLGTDVRVNVEREPHQAEGDIMNLFGVLDDHTFAEAVAKIVQDRDSLPTKPPVELDAAS